MVSLVAPPVTYPVDTSRVYSRQTPVANPTQLSPSAAPFPLIVPQRNAVHYLRVRAKVLCGVIALFGVFTFVSFWAMFYWTILIAFMMVYLSIVCFREAAHFGAIRSPWGFSGGLFVGRELVVVLCGVTMLLCFAESVVGVILCITESDATRVVFQAIGATTGVVSLAALILLHTTLKHLEAPLMNVAHGPPPAGGTVCYYDSQPQPAVRLQTQPVIDSFQRSFRLPQRRPPSPRRVTFEPDDPTRADPIAQSPRPFVIPPAGLEEMDNYDMQRSRRTPPGPPHAPFGSPMPRVPAPYPYPAQRIGPEASPGRSIYA
jgi:hypothetical protein